MLNSNYYNKILSILLIAQFLIACDIDIDTNIPDVPPEGRFAVVAANQHNNVTSAEVAIAIFEDAVPVNLVGADVVQASTTDDSILLLDRGFYTGSYAASLPNPANLNQIDFLMVHKPIEARQRRWYPADLINIDPGPGEFVGASAMITLPPFPANVATSGTDFNSINDSFIITWTPEISGDIMIIRSAITCSDDTNIYTYGTEPVLGDSSDDGTQTINLDQFIYDTKSTTPPPFNFLLGESRAALQELISKLNELGIAEDFFENFPSVNPIANSCEIQLFLFRQRDGAFDSPSTNGRIYGSRSTDLTLQYNPN
jgi:hypothetical protein